MKRPAVYLIGAGPGDPGLITVRGLARLQAADVIVYDHLVPARLLSHARPGAELIAVGQGASQPLAQEAISYLLADKAREGKVVARLKAGDPFLFDRGGEEALFLHEQGIPYEIVPGVPACTGIAAYAGVPITYPGGGDTVTFIRGHEDDEREAPDVNWECLSRLDGTIVCHAGPQQLPRILEALLANGWPADERAVLIVDGTLPSQQSIEAPLGELAVQAREHVRRGPALLIVGRVVGFREHLRWFDARPLFGRRVLVTRPRDQAAELVDALTALGAEAILAPLIRIEAPLDRAPLDQAAAEADRFDWIVFSSVNAVTAFMDALLQHGRDVRALSGPRICVVGPATAEKLRSYGVHADLMPADYRAEGVVAAILAAGPVKGARVLLPRADIAREVIAERLRDAGADVTAVVAYRTVVEDAPQEDPDVYRMLLNGSIDVVTFTSPSAVRNFVRIYGTEQSVDLLRNAVVAVIGPLTADAARQLGLPVTIQPAEYTTTALVDAIAAYYAPR